MEKISQGGEAPASAAARRDAWAARVIVPAPLTVEELATHLIRKGTITDDEIAAIKANRD